MKVITITQPWATLVAIGAKKIETRSWYTRYRGPLAIHAAKDFPSSAQRLFNHSQFREALIDGGYLRFGMPFTFEIPTGVIIATCELSEVYATHHYDLLTTRGLYGVSEVEKCFGDYSDTRYGFILQNVRKLETPIPAKGRLGLWEYPVEDFL